MKPCLRVGMFLLALAMAGCAGVARDEAAVHANVGPDKVVYHVSDAEAQGTLALQNIRNHLEVNPAAKIIVVTHARGVDLLLDGATNHNGNPYNIAIEELKARGVEFEVCEITLRERQLSKSRFIPEATYVASGVAEITRLQQREGYAYLRP